MFNKISVRVGIVLILVALFFGFATRNDILISFSKPVDINVDYPKDYKDVKAVETEISMVLDVFATEETTTKSKSGAVTSRKYDYYYIIPVFTENEDETYFAGLKVSSDKSKPYEQIEELTWQYLNGEIDHLGDKTVHFQGGFVKMEDEAYKYFEEWFSGDDFFENDEEMHKYLLPLVLKTVDYKVTRIATYVLAGILLLGIILLVIGFIPGKKTTAPSKPVVTINGVNYPSSNFENVNKLIEKGDQIKAIKEFRDATGLGLAEAKDIIDHWNQYW